MVCIIALNFRLQDVSISGIVLQLNVVLDVGPTKNVVSSARRCCISALVSNNLEALYVRSMVRRLTWQPGDIACSYLRLHFAAHCGVSRRYIPCGGGWSCTFISFGACYSPRCVSSRDVLDVRFRVRIRTKCWTASDVATGYFTYFVLLTFWSFKTRWHEPRSRPVIVTALEHECHELWLAPTSSVSTDWHSNKHYFALQCATTTTRIK